MKNLFIIALLPLYYSCGSDPIDIKKEEKKLMDLSREWSKSVTSKNVDKIVSYWDEQAVYMSPGRPSLNGRAKIREMVERSLKMPGFSISWEPVSASVSASGDMGYLIENNTISYEDSLGKQQQMTSRVVSIWKKDKKGEWKNAVDISIDN